MTTAFYLLLLIGHLGAFDVLYFHGYRCRLAERPESRREVLWHTLRHAVYAGQFLAVANLRFHGAALLVLLGLYAADVFIAWADVWEETASRRSQGGLPRGEYFMHIVLSVLVGAYIANVAQDVWPDRLLPTAVVVSPPAVPEVLRALMTFMGLTAALVFVHDLAKWLLAGSTAKRRIVVQALIDAPVDRVWERTQDPALHVKWDIRFDAIRYTGETDARGFEKMSYETSLGFGLTVAGTGRYLQDRPLEHSTFEFASSDWKSLIAKGRGIWRYEPRGDRTFFETVFDYKVRHGVPGAVFDRLVFRPLFQLATEWGFETLRLWCAGDDEAPARRTRRAFVPFFVKRVLGVRPAPGAARSWIGRPLDSRSSSRATKESRGSLEVNGRGALGVNGVASLDVSGR